MTQSRIILSAVTKIRSLMPIDIKKFNVHVVICLRAFTRVLLDLFFVSASTKTDRIKQERR
jgi:hypothetical protein